MKIAILLVGEYRTFAHCRKTMKFLDQDNIDIYFSTWDKTNTINPQRIGSTHWRSWKPVTIPVSENEIESAIGKECKIAIHDSKIPDNEKIDWKKMVRGWILGIDFVKRSNISYDYIFLLRPDLFFDGDTELLIEQFENYKNAIGAQKDNESSVSDFCFFGTFENISKIMDPSLLTNRYDDSLTIHQILSTYIKDENNLNIIPLPMSINSKFLISRFPASADDDFISVRERWNRWFMKGRYG